MADTRIVITAQADQAQSTLQRLGQGVDGLGGKFSGLIGLAGGLGGALSITAFAAFIKNTVDGIDVLNDLADATGASIEMLSGLEDRAARTGTSMDVVGTALIKFNNVLNEAKPGSPAELAFKQIGLSVEELKKLDPAQALQKYAVALNGFADDGNKARLVQDQLGKSVRDVAPLLKDLAEGGELVAKVTSAQAAEAERFNHQLSAMKKDFADLGRSIALEVLPVVQEITAGFSEFNETGQKTSVIGEAISIALETVVVLGAEIGFILKQTGREIGGVIAQFSALGEGGGIFSAEGRRAWTVVGDEMKKDAETARKEHDDFVQRVMTARQRARDAGAGGAAGGSTAPSVGPIADPAALKAAAAEAEKLRQQDIAGWVKYAEAVLAEGERVEEITRKQIEDANKAEQEKINRVLESFNTKNQTLAEAMAQQDLTEEQRVLRKRDQELARLDEEKQTLMAHKAWTLELEASYDQARFNAQAQASAAIIKLEKQTAMQKQQVLAGSLATISSLMSNQNVALFRIGQAASIANATISTIEGATKALSLGPIIGPPLAAAIYVAGAANIAQIASTQIGGGTPSPVNATFSGGSVQTGTTPAPITALPAPNAGLEAPRSVYNVTFQGSQFTLNQMVDEIIPLFNEASANGADIRINRG